jgi:hypothetical protein
LVASRSGACLAMPSKLFPAPDRAKAFANVVAPFGC